jgi:energy-coupling factor transporter ATP-binding protein EcfA2
MLKRLHLQNFTVFADTEFEFGPGLNVLVGNNGTGKSHVLKLGYGILKGLRGQLLRSAVSRGDVESQNRLMQVQGKRTYNPFFADVLLGIFRPSPLNLQELVRRGKEEEASVVFDLYNEDVATGHYRFDMLHASEQPLVHSSSALATPTETVNRIEAQVAPPILIPAKEILTLGWMAAASDTLVLPLDDSYLDLLSQLGRLPLRNPELSAQLAVEKITQIVGGELEQRGGSFYLVSLNQGPMEVGMIAEGMRKFGTLQRLLSNGSLTSKTTLFWDEPEANLNPALLQKLAAILAELARQGFQIVLATHSTDLLKEFHILSRQKDAKPLPIKYFGLNARPGEATTVVTTDNFEHLPDVVALEVELKQADELEEIFIREDREYYANNRGEQPSL